MRAKFGVPMQLYTPRVRYVRQHGVARKLGYDDIARVRAQLRTEASIPEIADTLGVGVSALKRFIKNRGIANLQERASFLSRQRRFRLAPEFTNTLSYKPGRGQV